SEVEVLYHHVAVSRPQIVAKVVLNDHRCAGPRWIDIKGIYVGHYRRGYLSTPIALVCLPPARQCIAEHGEVVGQRISSRAVQAPALIAGEDVRAGEPVGQVLRPGCELAWCQVSTSLSSGNGVGLTPRENGARIRSGDIEVGSAQRREIAGRVPACVRWQS